MPDSSDAAAPPDGRGFVFAASGRSYITLATMAARSLRAHHPDAPIDLYTDPDASVPDDLFSRVHALNKSWFRPKFEALTRARFAQTIYLDADMYVTAPIDDVFAVLDRFDIAAAHVQNRNQTFARRIWRREMPNAFPQINSGLLGIRASPAVTALFAECHRVMEEEGLRQDQPVLRELLFDSPLSLAILPPEYNARSNMAWRFGSSNLTAPRILHHSAFHKLMKDDDTVPPPWRVYGPLFMRHVRALIRADRTLTPGTRDTVPAPNDYAGRLARLFRR